MGILAESDQGEEEKYREVQSQRNTTRGVWTCRQQRLSKAASTATTWFRIITTAAALHPEMLIQQLSPWNSDISWREKKRQQSFWTWNPRNKSIKVKQQVILTRTLHAWQPPVWQQRKRLNAVQQNLTSFQFLSQSEAEQQPKVALPGLFVQAWKLFEPQPGTFSWVST